MKLCNGKMPQLHIIAHHCTQLPQIFTGMGTVAVNCDPPARPYCTPGTSPQAPGTSPQAPGTKHLSPSTRHQAPLPKHQAPGTSSQAPSTRHQTLPMPPRSLYIENPAAINRTSHQNIENPRAIYREGCSLYIQGNSIYTFVLQVLHVEAFTPLVKCL